MGFALLASATRGLFIAMLIIMIVVSALFALIVFIALRPVKKPPEEVDPNNVRSMLTRRESNLLLELMACKDDEAKKSELINKLRRVKSAMALVDELIEEEKAIEQASEEDENNRKKRRAEEASKKPAVKRSAPTKNGAPKSAKPQNGTQPRHKPVQKKQDPLEFRPSQEPAQAPVKAENSEQSPVPEKAQETGESEELITVSKLIGETPDDKKE